MPDAYTDALVVDGGDQVAVTFYHGVFLSQAPTPELGF